MHTEARARENTVHETGDPRVSDPNHGAGNDTGEVGALGDAIGIVGFVEEDTGHDLRR